MRKFLLLTGIFSLLLAAKVAGQQDPAFTNYFFNSLIFNPAVAGSNEHLTAHLVHRSQWIGLEGAPTTQSLSVHSPLANERIGLGASLVNDNLGASGVLELNTAYAYRFPLGEDLHLSVGLQAGVSNWRGNWSELTVEDATDEVFAENLNRWLPNFGAGVYLSGERIFAGVGCPRILEHDLRGNDRNTSYYAKNYRHYYAIVGGAFPLGSEQLIFRPSALIKNTGLFSDFRKSATQLALGSPTVIDLDASFFLRETLWIGVAYRTALELGDSSNDSVDFRASFYFRNGVRVGASYDWTLSQISRAGNGSVEVMAGYEFDVKIKRVASPRYF